MEFTKKEISLCKQVAERHGKEIDYGDWYWDEGLKKAVVQSVKLAHLQDDPYFIKNCFPLWSISDCLEFLRERGLWIIGLQQDEDEFSFGFAATDDLGMRIIEETATWADGETPLEACLKAVLAVLEVKKESNRGDK
ncbi:MAG: hypothetical protein HWN68_06455 [Desulfobacterales bacterium]|nr:hypothetical protein [Desulfobacterales bacterium]